MDRCNFVIIQSVFDIVPQFHHRTCLSRAYTIKRFSHLLPHLRDSTPRIVWHHDTQHNNIQHNNTQRNEVYHKFKRGVTLGITSVSIMILMPSVVYTECLNKVHDAEGCWAECRGAPSLAHKY
jgi:hypothetical protein